VAKRAEKKIYFRGLAPLDAAGKNVKAQDETYFREMRLINAAKFSAKKFENEIKIFDGKMLIVSFEPEVFAILTESKTVFETQTQIFGILWELMDA
jgi:hypothetical protein